MFNISSLQLDDALKRTTPLINGAISGVAGLSASSSSKVNTLNIWCKTAGCDNYFRQFFGPPSSLSYVQHL